MKRAVGTKFLCYQCGHRWLNEYQYVERCPKCKHRGFNWKQEPNLDGEEWRDCSLLGKHQISNAHTKISYFTATGHEISNLFFCLHPLLPRPEGLLEAPHVLIGQIRCRPCPFHGILILGFQRGDLLRLPINQFMNL